MIKKQARLERCIPYCVLKLKIDESKKQVKKKKIGVHFDTFYFLSAKKMILQFGKLLTEFSVFNM